ncbi:hypothetical protein SAMN02910289_01792 [Lachnospiraceae bacterium RM5]|nr:hypothetical protein SAMN02910289_01792 [Lachnospiraceae bacterium RM5]
MRRRRRRGYQYTEVINSKNNIISILIFVAAFATLMLGIYKSYKMNANAGGIVGLIAVFSFAISIVGIKFGIMGIKNKEKMVPLSYISIALNGLMILFIVAIIIYGLLTI